MRYAENIVEPDRPQMTWRMPIACWITEATNTHLQYVILSAFPLQQWLHESATLLRCTSSSSQAGPEAHTSDAPQPRGLLCNPGSPLI